VENYRSGKISQTVCRNLQRGSTDKTSARESGTFYSGHLYNPGLLFLPGTHCAARKEGGMKVTINLNDAEVRGLKKYLKEVGNISSPTKADIVSEISGIITGVLHSQREAVFDYISLEEQKDNRKINL
jgi:hypothetical protein